MTGVGREAGGTATWYQVQYEILGWRRAGGCLRLTARPNFARLAPALLSMGDIDLRLSRGHDTRSSCHLSVTPGPHF